MTMKTVTVRIRGRVQGVWYRSWTIQEATHRGLVGWVRNRMDNSVEALFHGSVAAVNDMIAACYKGPLMARVDDIHISIASPPPVDHNSFNKLSTL